MTDDPGNSDTEERLSELALQWEERHQRGEEISAAALCTDCPDLTEELQQRIAKLTRVNAVLGPIYDDFATVDSDQSSATDKSLLDTRAASVSGTLQTTARYRIVSQHAVGGIGEVLLAIDEKLDRTVALKRIRKSPNNDPERRERFWREATITGRLEHPGIVPVHGLGEDESGQPCYVMRFIEGETLLAAIQRHHSDATESTSPIEARLNLRQLLTRFVAACNTVGYAHSQNVLHRDLKPSNIMLGPYAETLVVDWGLAKNLTEDEEQDRPEAESEDECAQPAIQHVELQSRTETADAHSTDAEAKLTQTGAALGTPAFMSPEQAGVRPAAIGPASDIYSLGATLFVLLTGKPPFDGVPLAALFDRLKHGEIPKPLSANPSVPRPLDAICCKAMAAVPEQRYATALDLARDIECWLGDEPVSAYREPLLSQARRVLRRYRSAVTAAAIVSMMLLLTGWVMANAFQERRIAALTREIQVGLDAPAWEESHIATMRTLISKLMAVSPELAAADRERLHARIADVISTGLQEQRLDAPSTARLQAMLDDLAAHHDPRATTLSAALQQRLRAWEPVFELRSPFSNQAKVFGKSLPVQGGALENQQPAPTQRSGLATETVLTEIVTPSHAQLVAEFERLDDRSVDFGLWLDAHLTPEKKVPNVVHARGYAFVVSNGRTTGSYKRLDQDADLAESSESAPQRIVELQILRDGLVQASRRLSLPSGIVKLTVSRQHEQLNVQLNDLPPMSFLDPFPLRGDAPGKYGIILPKQIRLLTLTGFRQPLPSMSSPLERADEGFMLGQFEEAVRLYQEAARTASSDAAIEARYKSGLCLLKLNREQEANELFEAVMSESTGRWSLLAGCQLWAQRSQGRQFEAADAIQDSIQTKYSVRDLYAMVPAELRADILKSYQTSGVNHFLYQPELIRNLERTHAAMKLLGETPNSGIRTSLIRAYRLVGEEGKALELALESLERSTIGHSKFDLTHLEDVCWIRRRQDQAEKVVADLTRRLRVAPRTSTSEIYYCQAMAVERARALINLGRAEEAEASLRELLASYKIDRVNSHARCSAYLVLGWLQADRGDKDGAKSTWHLGHTFESELPEPGIKPRVSYLAGSSNIDVSRLIMLALSEELDDASATEIHKRLTRSLSNNPQVSQFLTSLGTPTKEYRKMWLTPRGRDWARRFAYRDLSFADFVQVPVLLTMHQGLRDLTFATAPSDEQDEQLWQFCRHLQDAYAKGDVGVPQVMQLVLTWKGTTNILGWAGVAPKLSPALRAEAAYFASIRYQRLKRPADSALLLKTATTDAAPDAPIRKLLPEPMN